MGYLKPDERAAIIDWLPKNNYGNLGELKAYIEERYEIVFSSQQSYYKIFDSAGSRKEKIVEVPIVNEKERHTYFGERKYCDGSMSAPGIPKGKWRTYYSIFKVSDEPI